MFAQSVLKNVQLGCLVYGIITIKGRVTSITNEVLSSRHNCVIEVYFCDYESPVRLANCTAYIRHCPLHTDYSCFKQVLHFTKNPSLMSKYTKCRCKLCVKDKPPNLKSLCVNKLYEIY